MVEGCWEEDARPVLGGDGCQRGWGLVEESQGAGGLGRGCQVMALRGRCQAGALGRWQGEGRAGSPG